MSGYIEQVLLNNVNYENDIIEKNKININDIIELISKNMEKKYFNKTVIEEFLDEYLNVDSKTNISQEQFFSAIQNNIINLDMINEFFKKKPTRIEIFELLVKIGFKGFETSIDSIINRGHVKYSDETINNFIKLHILNWNLSQDLKQDETPLDYLKRIYNLYYQSTSEVNLKLLKNKISSRYYTDILKLHSLILSKSIEINSELIKMFTDFLSRLYFDRDDGYNIKPFNLSKPFETENLDINTLFQNTPLQVNLFNFIEEQREPDWKKRTDSILIKKLLEIGKIFNSIGYKVIIVGSKFKTNSNNQGVWANIPYKFDEIYPNIIESYPKLPFNAINIYLEVDFECM